MPVREAGSFADSFTAKGARDEGALDGATGLVFFEVDSNTLSHLGFLLRFDVGSLILGKCECAESESLHGQTLNTLPLHHGRKCV